MCTIVMKGYSSKKGKVVVGIDEAGRGPLAGPVSIGSVSLFPGPSISLRGLKDSKQLTERDRETWFKKIQDGQKEGRLQYAVSLISHKVIDKKGIVHAIQLGISRNLKKLGVDPKSARIFLDGSLKAPEEYQDQKTIIKGDEKIPIIALASIVAKVTRDRAMKKYGRQYPHYGLEVHKGYGTKRHRDAIKKYGAAIIHRKTFLGNFDK